MQRRTNTATNTLPVARFNTVSAGGSAFALPDVTIGVFQVSQPQHRIGLGSDKELVQPLGVDEGWILPESASGSCAFETSHDFTTISIPSQLLNEVGVARDFRPMIGQLDPLLVQFVKSSAAVGTNAPLLYRQTIARALVAHLGQVMAPCPVEQPIADDPRLRRALAYIHDHLAEELSLDTMAAEAAMSSFHFSRVFKATTGLSPLRYVIAERVKLAGVLLRTTKLPVAQIAYRVGYEDLSRFGEHFKRNTGTTPAAFRAG